MINISEFQTKDVVNVADGKRLGNIIDIDIDEYTGAIKDIYLNESSGMRLFKKNEMIKIPWSNIIKIGSDVILVRYTE